MLEIPCQNQICSFAKSLFFRTSAAFLIFGASVALTGCFSGGALGPRARVAVMKSESKTEIQKIMVADLIGDKKAADFIKGAAVTTYGASKALPAKLAMKIAKKLRIPEDAVTALHLGYQVEFAKTYDEFRALKKEAKGKGKKKKRTPPPKAMSLPPGEFAKPKGDAKALVKALQAEAEAIKALATAAESRDLTQMKEAYEAHQNAVGLLTQVNFLILEKAKANYMLLSKLEGSEETFKKGKPLHLTAVLMNPKNGQFRFFAEVPGKKKPLTPDYKALIMLMATNLFDKAQERDPVAAMTSEPDAQDSAPEKL